MAAEEGDFTIRRYIYRGEEYEVIPEDATHATVREDVTVVLAFAFQFHPSIVEVICHDKVERIEEDAFYECSSLRRVIMPGVKIVENSAFVDCDALTEVECGKLEIIEDWAFNCCKFLRSINLPSVRVIKEGGSNIASPDGREIW